MGIEGKIIIVKSFRDFKASQKKNITEWYHYGVQIEI